MVDGSPDQLGDRHLPSPCLRRQLVKLHVVERYGSSSHAPEHNL